MSVLRKPNTNRKRSDNRHPDCRHRACRSCSPKRAGREVKRLHAETVRLKNMAKEVREL